LPSPKPNIPTT
jgi:chromosome segregation ATPase